MTLASLFDVEYMSIAETAIFALLGVARRETANSI